MLSEALAYPRRGEGSFGRHIIGGVLIFFSFAVLPLILLFYGYMVEVFRGRVAGDPQPPGWGDWGALFLDGLTYIGIALVYSVPLVAVALVSLPAAAVVALPVAYLVPGAVINYVVEDDLVAAFRLPTIVSTTLSRPYAAAWLQALVLGVVVGFVGVVLLFIVIGLLLLFYLGVLVSYLLADGYLEAMDEPPAASGATESGGDRSASPAL